MIHVIAYLHLRPGVREEFLGTLRELTPQVRAESGCIEYTPAVDHAPFLGFQSPIGDDTVMVIEKWASPAALEAHIEAPHMKAWGKRVEGMMTGRTIQVLRPGDSRTGSESRRCPTCGTTYAAGRFCVRDGALLELR